mgnify:CR=1 FL=1
MCTIVFNVSKPISCLVVGGGGGGGAGNYVPLYSPNFSSGGGGAGFINDTFNIPTNIPFSIQVASAGLGRQATNPGQGNSTGYNGGSSSLTGGAFSFVTSGGGGGKGIGTAQGYAGGGGGGSNLFGGGKAGFISGGDGTGNTTPGCGEDAVSGFSQLYGNYFYGSGGGGGVGGYIPVPISNFGGSGSNGVVMLWWLD